MRPMGIVSVIIAVALIFLFPILFSQLLIVSLEKLHIVPNYAVILVLGILLGGMVNIPLQRVPQADMVVVNPLSVYGLPQSWPKFGRAFRETIVAVNLGGCVIPVAVAAYEAANLDPSLWGPTIIAVVINVGVCFALARPVPGVGITIPGLVPGLVAAILVMLFAPADAAPVAFIAGVAGPLVGADFMHLKDVTRTATGIASIGGAGTFDGIVLSGVIAAYLA